MMSTNNVLSPCQRCTDYRPVAGYDPWSVLTTIMREGMKGEGMVFSLD